MGHSEYPGRPLIIFSPIVDPAAILQFLGRSSLHVLSWAKLSALSAYCPVCGFAVDRSFSYAEIVQSACRERCAERKSPVQHVRYRCGSRLQFLRSAGRCRFDALPLKRK